MKIKYLIFLCFMSINSIEKQLEHKDNLCDVITNKNFIIDDIKIILRNYYNSNNPYKYIPSNVRQSLDICDEEKKVISKRLIRAKENLEHFLNLNIQEDNFPRIAICLSGGGYRSMIATLGALIGLNEIGLLDSISYASCLSGSTWTFASWYSYNCDLETLKQNLSTNISLNPRINNFGFLPPITKINQINALIKNITAEYLFDQPLELIDIYGAILANNLLSTIENNLNLKLSDHQKIINSGEHIFPIYNAIEPTDNDLIYNWYEFSPYEVGSYASNCYVPTWAFGRKFINGESIASATIERKEFGPELSLGYMLGIFGSAFEVDIDEIIKIFKLNELKYIEKIAVNSLIKKLISCLDEKRLFPSKTFNFTFSMNSSPNKNEEMLTLIDAGIDLNLPFPPLLRPSRKIDIIIVIDASSDLKGAPQLALAQQYAERNNIKFPIIDFTNIEQKSISIFADQNDPLIPTIIYLPLTKDLTLKNIVTNEIIKNFEISSCIASGFCNTFNFAYSKNEFNKLCELMRFNVFENKEKIKEAILNKIKNKN